MGHPMHSPTMGALFLLLTILLLTLVAGVAIHPPEYDHLATNSSSSLLNTSFSSNVPNGIETISASRPDDMSWIKKWAAVGDSYTAGIGAGQLYSDSEDDHKCSRYDKSYPAILKRTIGPSATNFKYVACSGARTAGILDQVKGLENDMDLVVMTAGGNDLCLSAIIRNCILMPYGGSNCEDAIHKAERNLESILPGNLRQILNALDEKMAHDGIVIFASYAQFFYAVADGDDCARNQDFTFPRTSVRAPLTVERRQQFNDLVVKTNQLIKKLVAESRDKRLYKYHIRYADWDVWPRNKEIAGQMCWPGSTGKVPDPKQPRLQFFKPTTNLPDHQDLRMQGNSTDVYPVNETVPVDPVVAEKRWFKSLDTSSLYRTVNPSSEVLSRLDARHAIRQEPDCPGDGGSGLGVPDRWGKFYHPNDLGHQTIASFVMNEIISARGEILHTNNPVCEKRDSFMCFYWVVADRPHWNNPALLDATYQKYCDEVKPGKSPNWVDQRVFNEFTNEAHRYTIRLENGAVLFSKTQCLDAFKYIIYSCDTDKKDNPHSWKHGGTYKRGSYTYELQPWTSHKRAWPLDQPIAKCEGHYRGAWSKYKLRGSGWLDDNGERLRHAANRCVGGGVTDWEFKWLLEPDQDQMEWQATFHTPIWVRNRCFKNNKVQKSVGGPDGGCTGSD